MKITLFLLLIMDIFLPKHLMLKIRAIKIQKLKLLYKIMMLLIIFNYGYISYVGASELLGTG